jgi:hypothetical protein
MRVKTVVALFVDPEGPYPEMRGARSTRETRCPMKPIILLKSPSQYAPEWHTEYAPCACVKCSRWFVYFEDSNGNEIPVGGEGPSASIDEDPPSTERYG